MGKLRRRVRHGLTGHGHTGHPTVTEAAAKSPGAIARFPREQQVPMSPRRR